MCCWLERASHTNRRAGGRLFPGARRETKGRIIRFSHGCFFRSRTYHSLLKQILTLCFPATSFVQPIEKISRGKNVLFETCWCFQPLVQRGWDATWDLSSFGLWQITLGSVSWEMSQWIPIKACQGWSVNKWPVCWMPWLLEEDQEMVVFL